MFCPEGAYWLLQHVDSGCLVASSWSKQAIYRVLRKAIQLDWSGPVEEIADRNSAAIKTMLEAEPQVE